MLCIFWTDQPGPRRFTSQCDVQIMQQLSPEVALIVLGDEALPVTVALPSLTALYSVAITGDDELLSIKGTSLLRGRRCVKSLRELAFKQFPVCNGQTMGTATPDKITGVVHSFCKELEGMKLTYLCLQGWMYCGLLCTAVSVGEPGTRFWQHDRKPSEAPKARDVCHTIEDYGMSVAVPYLSALTDLSHLEIHCTGPRN